MVFLMPFLSRFLVACGLVQLCCNFSAASVIGFGTFDVDSSGGITAEEFETELKAQGYRMSADRMEVFYKAIDGDGSGTLDAEEYVALTKLSQWWTEARPVVQIFYSADRNADRYISSEELSIVFPSVSKEQINDLMKGNDMLDMQEFIQAVEALG